jgi:hypothetical protein
VEPGKESTEHAFFKACSDFIHILNRRVPCFLNSRAFFRERVSITERVNGFERERVWCYETKTSYNQEPIMQCAKRCRKVNNETFRGYGLAEVPPVFKPAGLTGCIFLLLFERDDLELEVAGPDSDSDSDPADGAK